MPACVLCPSTPLHRPAGHNYIGTEHLLLALLRQPEGMPNQETQPAMLARLLCEGLLCVHGSLLPFEPFFWVVGHAERPWQGNKAFDWTAVP